LNFLSPFDPVEPDAPAPADDIVERNRQEATILNQYVSHDPHRRETEQKAAPEPNDIDVNSRFLSFSGTALFSSLERNGRRFSWMEKRTVKSSAGWAAPCLPTTHQ
jgi:hypothetical protein